MVEDHGWTELSDGDEFAGYRIERRLGRGGMGILYLAVEPGLDRRVALKLIAPEAAAEEVFARRFAEESRIAASIEHPNVVPIYAAGEEDGVPFIAMRFVAGSDLGQRIARDGRLEPAHAVALIAQVGNGLDAIHAAGLVHRDVKPANVLLSGERGRRARLHHRLRRRPQRRHPVGPDPDRPLRRHPRLRRPGADLRRRRRRPGRRLRARLPALQAADRRGPVPARRRGGAPLRPPQRPAAGALAVRAGGARWRSTTSSSGRCRSSPTIAIPRPATSAAPRSRR